MSVVIPVGPNESAWTGLLHDLAALPRESEVICVGADAAPEAWHECLRSFGLAAGCRWIRSPAGRARQLNLGARLSNRMCLWFLHADSRLTPNTLDALAVALAAPRTVHYFRLAFAGGPRFMRFTQWGVRIRSEWLGLPFGDQGLCLDRSHFDALGGYDESAMYGEDHLLVWAAHRAGISVRCTGATLITSARKYREHGWWRTTRRHLALTWKQALPEWRRMRRERRARRHPPAPSRSL